jgi:hypothetical protein
LTWGEKNPRRTKASDRLFRCSFPYFPVEDEHNDFYFQNSEFVLYVFLPDGMERHVSAPRWTDECYGQLRRFATPEMEKGKFLFGFAINH